MRYSKFRTKPQNEDNYYFLKIPGNTAFLTKNEILLIIWCVGAMTFRIMTLGIMTQNMTIK
jgi:hypothetical protein